MKMFIIFSNLTNATENWRDNPENIIVVYDRNALSYFIFSFNNNNNSQRINGHHLRIYSERWQHREHFLYKQSYFIQVSTLLYSQLSINLLNDVVLLIYSTLNCQNKRSCFASRHSVDCMLPASASNGTKQHTITYKHTLRYVNDSTDIYECMWYVYMYCLAREVCIGLLEQAEINKICFIWFGTLVRLVPAHRAFIRFETVHFPGVSSVTGIY